MDDEIAKQIEAKASRAPRVTPADIEAEIASEHYFTAQDGVLGAFNGGRYTGTLPSESAARALWTLTICVLVLRNGYTAVGWSAPASPSNFDPEIGRNVARRKAIDQIWPLLGFRLRDALHAAEKSSS